MHGLTDDGKIIVYDSNNLNWENERLIDGYMNGFDIDDINDAGGNCLIVNYTKPKIEEIVTKKEPIPSDEKMHEYEKKEPENEGNTTTESEQLTQKTEEPKPEQPKPQQPESETNKVLQELQINGHVTQEEINQLKNLSVDQLFDRISEYGWESITDKNQLKIGDIIFLDVDNVSGADKCYIIDEELVEYIKNNDIKWWAFRPSK